MLRAMHRALHEDMTGSLGLCGRQGHLRAGLGFRPGWSVSNLGTWHQIQHLVDEIAEHERNRIAAVLARRGWTLALACGGMT